MMMNFFTPFFASESERGLGWCFQQNDMFGWGVIILLTICSVSSISVIVGRIFALHKTDKENKLFEKTLGNVDFTTYRARTKGELSAYEQMIGAGLNGFFRAGTSKTEPEFRLRMNYMQNSLQRFLARKDVDYGKGLGTLSIFVTIGPFIGLFGTVYGVIITFASLTEKASIAQLAPGVSAALTATMMGLVLAIPALIAYNKFLETTKRMYTELENFSSIFYDTFEVQMREKILAEKILAEKILAEKALEKSAGTPAEPQNSQSRAGTLSAEAE